MVEHKLSKLPFVQLAALVRMGGVLNRWTQRFNLLEKMEC
jgi:hypothetical protein